MADIEVTVHLTGADEIETRATGEYNWIELGGVGLFLGRANAEKVRNADRLIEAAQEYRARALARMVKADDRDETTEDDGWTNREGMPEFNGSFR